MVRTGVRCPAMSHPLDRLEQLRQQRGKPEREWGIGSVIASIEREGRRRDRNLGRAGELWDQLLPAELVRQTKLVGFRGGVLSVIVESASARYELDRALRGGLEQQLRAQLPNTLVRIKVTVGRFD